MPAAIGQDAQRVQVLTNLPGIGCPLGAACGRDCVAQGSTNGATEEIGRRRGEAATYQRDHNGCRDSVTLIFARPQLLQPRFLHETRH